jgi:hypothetical protein
MQNFEKIYSPGEITRLAKAQFRDERAKPRLDGWFLAREAALDAIDQSVDVSPERAAANALAAICRTLPLSIGQNAVFAGSQSDAFARTYALINPTFRVESFSGYCDPTAVFDDIEPSPEIPIERIENLRERTRQTPFVRALSDVYEKCERDTREVIYFVEQVTVT